MCFESEMNFWSIDDFHYSKNNDDTQKYSCAQFCFAFFM